MEVGTHPRNERQRGNVQEAKRKRRAPATTIQNDEDGNDHMN
jgi:hypothetical protein